MCDFAPPPSPFPPTTPPPQGVSMSLGVSCFLNFLQMRKFMLPEYKNLLWVCPIGGTMGGKGGGAPPPQKIFELKIRTIYMDFLL